MSYNFLLLPPESLCHNNLLSFDPSQREKVLSQRPELCYHSQTWPSCGFPQRASAACSIPWLNLPVTSIIWQQNHRSLWFNNTIIRHCSITVWLTSTLTSLLHQRPADINEKGFLCVFSRRHHFPVPRVHSQRGEVVRVSVTVTKIRRDKHWIKQRWWKVCCSVGSWQI